jgi:hypothetical protein
MFAGRHLIITNLKLLTKYARMLSLKNTTSKQREWQRDEQELKYVKDAFQMAKELPTSRGEVLTKPPSGYFCNKRDIIYVPLFIIFILQWICSFICKNPNLMI